MLFSSVIPTKKREQMFHLSSIPEWLLLCIYLFTMAPTIVVILLENRNIL